MNNQLNQEDLPKIELDCIEYFKTILQNNKFIRIAVETGGCSGFQYAFYLDSWDMTDVDIILNKDPLIITDPVTINLIKNSIIKFDNTPFNKRVYIDNPNTTASCGCGKSFHY